MVNCFRPAKFVLYGSGRNWREQVKALKISQRNENSTKLVNVVESLRAEYWRIYGILIIIYTISSLP